MQNKNQTSENQSVQRLEDSLGFLVNGVARLMRVELETRLEQFGLTPTTWTVLMTLGEEDKLNQTDIGKRCFLNGATITRALDLLNIKGFTERHRVDEDRRGHIVTLTNSGRSLYKKAANLGRIVNDIITACLSSTDREKLKILMKCVINHVQPTEAERDSNGR